MQIILGLHNFLNHSGIVEDLKHPWWIDYEAELENAKKIEEIFLHTMSRLL